MDFRILGPLTVADDGRAVPLGGIKQRATLGFLLLHANQAMATSVLIKALWPGETAPNSARKILHNAVWGLRGALSVTDGAAAPALLTQAPGYRLRVNEEQVDLHRFQVRASEGRARLADSPVVAVRLLREALSLWRGPALADLAEAGIVWPALTQVQNARMYTMEDLFEAELACGRHHVVLGELEAMVEQEVLRERSCGQLMLALYRCGRHADALDVYTRTRTALVDLGLEPGERLQSLQRAVLTHDLSLSLELPTPRTELTQLTTANPAPPPAEPEPVTRPRTEPDATVRSSTESSSTESSGAGPAAVPDLAPAARSSARSHVSVVMVRVRVGSLRLEREPENVDESLDEVASVIGEEVERLGGVCMASIGSVFMALFGVPEQGQGDAERALRAALAIRGRLTGAVPAGWAPAVHVAVVTGEALVRFPPESTGATPSVNGALLDECRCLLATVPVGEIRICDRTRRLTEAAFTFHNAGDPLVGEQVGGEGGRQDGREPPPIVDREHELKILRGVLDRVRHSAQPHLVTILGDAGVGKSRFLAELTEHVRQQLRQEVTVLVGRTPSRPHDDALAVPAEIVTSYCGIEPADSPATADEKLSDTLARLVDTDGERAELLSGLRLLIDPAADRRGRRMTEVLHTWRLFVEVVARERPLVIAVDDAHYVHDAVLDTVEFLADSARGGPLLVVVAALPELLIRRSDWGGGKRHTATLTLDPLSGAGVDRLAEYRRFRVGGEQTRSPWQASPARTAPGEDPMARWRSVRRLLRTELAEVD